MTQKFRDCPDCGSMREFAQLHPQPQSCPDTADGRCPEWFCTGCGAAFLIGMLPASHGVPAGRSLASAGAGSAAGLRDRVA